MNALKICKRHANIYVSINEQGQSLIQVRVRCAAVKHSVLNKRLRSGHYNELHNLVAKVAIMYNSITIKNSCDE